MIDAVLAQRIEASKTPEDFFGPLIEPESAMRDAIALAYRRVVIVVHPDKHAGTAHESIAKELFRQVTALKDQAIRKLEAKVYGKREVPPPEDKPKTGPIRVEIKKTIYELEDILYHGDVADLYSCQWGSDQHGLFKIVRNAGDNDLIENEGRMLEKLGMAEDRTETVYKLFPRLHLSHSIRDKVGGTRRALIIGHYPNHVSLAEIIEAYPNGVDFRDVAWMWKRMLYAVGHAHKRGVVHGGITPDHVLVHPVEHGAKLLDWTSATMDGHVKIVSKKWKDNYPPEVMAKRAASKSTDIYMLSAAVEELLGLKAAKHENVVPVAISDFLKSCLIPAQGRRPDDAWQLHAELDELLSKLVGKRKYREFKMPARAGA